MPSSSIIEKLNRHGFLKKLSDEFVAFGRIGLNPESFAHKIDLRLFKVLLIFEY